MKLYYHPASPNCIPVLALADHLGLELERIFTDPFKGETRTPEYLKNNPNGKVPTLVDGDYVVWESNAIMIYLADQNETSLWPRDMKTRVSIIHWQFWQQAHWLHATGILTWERLIKSFADLGDPDPAEEKKGEEAVERYGAVLNASLEGKQYLVGDQLTLADFAVASPLVYAEPCRFPLKDFSHLHAWYARISELEAWQKNLPSM